MKTIARLRSVRMQRGIGAAALAKLAGIGRQTIYAVEDGTYVPNTAIALRLARVLETSVEELFSLDRPFEENEPALKAERLGSNIQDLVPGQSVRLYRVNGRLLAAPVSAIPAYLPPADGLVASTRGASVSVKSSGGASELTNRLVIAGCDPALGLLAPLLGASGFELVTVPCSSRRALEWLKQGRVHVAGSHLLDRVTGAYNVPFVKHLFPRGGVRVMNFALWEEGLLLKPGNPKGIARFSDLAQKNIRIVNRERGAGSRELLDAGLKQARISVGAVNGYDRLVRSHLEAALAVESGTADCAIATRSAARHFGLNFIPLAAERFDLSIPAATLELPAAQALLDLLNRSMLRRKLEAMAACDASHTGEMLL